jgi:hypothetical protein
MTTSTEPGAGAWNDPPYYSYRTCGTVPTDTRKLHTVNGIKNRLAVMGYLDGPAPNGVIGQTVRRAIIDYQIDEGLKVDGTIGPITARRMARKLVQDQQMLGRIPIPHNYLGGMIRLESNYDPGAQGLDRTKSTDRGLAQISDVFHPDITDQIAYGDWPRVIRFAADSLRESRPVPGGPSYGDLNRWDCAILHHNNPSKARKLHDTGEVDEQGSRYIWLVAVAANQPW